MKDQSSHTRRARGALFSIALDHFCAPAHSNVFVGYTTIPTHLLWLDSVAEIVPRPTPLKYSTDMVWTLEKVPVFE